MDSRAGSTQYAQDGPSVFALLIDDISKMSRSEQKTLWLQLNSDKISTLAAELDKAVQAHNLSSTEIDDLIEEAKKHDR